MSESPPEQWTRLEKLQYLLDQWDAIFDPNATSPFGPTRNGGRCTCGLGLPACDSRCGSGLMPKMASHPSVVELARCLALLRERAPSQFQHLKAYRCGCEWRIKTSQVKRRRARGKGFETVPERKRERIVPAWIKLDRVRRGERFLEAAFRGEVFIPEELWDALHRPAIAA